MHAIDYIQQYKVDMTVDDLVKHEFTLSKALRFQFTVHHPFRALDGLMVLLRDSVQEVVRSEVYVRAQAWLLVAMTTDLTLQFMPSQIAYCVLQKVLKDEHGMELVEYPLFVRVSMYRCHEALNVPQVLELVDTVLGRAKTPVHFEDINQAL
jgi:hypothetical protein